MTARIGALVLTALALGAMGSGVSLAQDAGPRRDTPQAQKDAQTQQEAAQEGRANDRLNNDPSLNNDQTRRQPVGRAAGDHAAGDQADLHRAHPHAAARCHDGFFTTTQDRSRACTRHGGIDVWLIG